MRRTRWEIAFFNTFRFRFRFIQWWLESSTPCCQIMLGTQKVGDFGFASHAYLITHTLLNSLVHHRELHIWTDEYILEGIHIRFERQQNKEFSFELQNPHFQCKFRPAMVVMPPASTARAQASYPDSRPGRNSRNTVDPLIKTCFQVSKWNQREKKGIFRCPDFFVSKFEMFTKLIQSYDQLKSISCFTSIPLSKKWPVSQSTLDEVHICRNKCKMDIYAELWT